jgi:hypothetical protein
MDSKLLNAQKRRVIIRTLCYMLGLFEFTLSFQLRRRHRVLRDLLGKTLLELEEAPFLAQRRVTRIQPDQEQMGHYRRRHGARHALGFLGHLHLF